MITAFVATALADVLNLGPELPCNCAKGQLEEVEYREDRKVSARIYDENGNVAYTVGDRMSAMGYTHTCTLDRGHRLVWCGPKGSLPICKSTPCGLGREVKRWSETGTVKTVEGAVATCRTWDANTRMTVFCAPRVAVPVAEVPVAEVPVPTEAPAPPTPASGVEPAASTSCGCQPGGISASLGGLVLLALAARRRPGDKSRGAYEKREK